MKNLYIILMATAAVWAQGVLAKTEPLKLSSDSRIEVVAYSPYQVVPVQGTTFTTTQITFAKNEFIENVQNGDLGAWTASIDKNMPSMLFLKPTTYDSHTNMTVVTNKHTYYFSLASNKKGDTSNNEATFALHFIYPAEARAKVEAQIIRREHQKQAEITAAKNPSDYNWDYSFHGDHRISPIHVFDDGKFTYLQLQPRQAVPAVFAVDSKNGKEALVNVRKDAKYLVIERIAPQFTLREGKDIVASIFNNRLIAKLKRHGYG